MFRPGDRVRHKSPPYYEGVVQSLSNDCMMVYLNVNGTYDRYFLHQKSCELIDNPDDYLNDFDD